MKLTVDVSDRDVPFLRVLGGLHRARGAGLAREDDDVTKVLEHLAASAADGVRRPGAWERSWVEQAFGDFSDKVEPDPEIRWHVRVRPVVEEPPAHVTCGIPTCPACYPRGR